MLPWCGVQITPCELKEILCDLKKSPSWCKNKKLEKLVCNSKTNFKTIDAWLEWCSLQQVLATKEGIRFVTIFDDFYPLQFLQLKRPPLILSYFGKWKTKEKRLAVVGSRKPMLSTIEWLQGELSQYLSQHEVVIVSGGAVGVDQVAHATAVRRQKRTVCFLPSGLLNVYPSSLKGWFKEIVKNDGLIVSQFPLNAKMKKWFFPQRNELIAMFSDAVFVAEARRRSGTAMTARMALDNNINVGVLPCSPLSPGMGGLDLLFDGAQLVRESNDLSLMVSFE